MNEQYLTAFYCDILDETATAEIIGSTAIYKECMYNVEKYIKSLKQDNQGQPIPKAISEIGQIAKTNIPNFMKVRKIEMIAEKELTKLTDSRK